ncbi:MAG: riboflavin synthase [Candidatus Micrarchaeota archaeon]
MAKIGIVDTMFARADMGAMALDEIKKHYPDVEIVRRTVPGVKDLPVECKRLLDEGCDSCMALGMVGGAPVDQVCAHEASLGIQQVKLLTNKHVIEAFVHENEAWSDKEFIEICNNRVRKHAHNAVLIVTSPETLVSFAGKGMRQGKADEGPASEQDKKIKIAIVAAQFNDEITGRMVESAMEAIGNAEAELTIVMQVAGVFEIPLAAKKLLMDKNNDAVVSLGAVIKGDTAHDELIAKTVARKLSDLSLEFNKPATLGIIGHDADYDAAEERADGYAERAVSAAVGLVRVLRA